MYWMFCSFTLTILVEYHVGSCYVRFMLYVVCLPNTHTVSLALDRQLVAGLQCPPVLLGHQLLHLLLRQVNAVVEVATPEHIVMWPQLPALSWEITWYHLTNVGKLIYSQRLHEAEEFLYLPNLVDSFAVHYQMYNLSDFFLQLTVLTT